MILKDFPESLHEEIVRRIKEFQDNMVFTPYDGARDFLEQLRERGFGIALVTSSDSSKMAELYRQQPWMRQAFDCIIDASMVTRSKPDPQGYLLAASRLGYSPEDCFVFEDSLQGLKAGGASGATVIGIATTYPAERLQGLADEIYDSVASIDIDLAQEKLMLTYCATRLRYGDRMPCQRSSFLSEIPPHLMEYSKWEDLMNAEATEEESGNFFDSLRSMLLEEE